MAVAEIRPAGRLRDEHESVIVTADLMAQGKEMRKHVPRSAHADYSPLASRNPVGVLQTQNAPRISELIPLRMSRMLQDSFAFYRGSAAIQAADLVTTAITGTEISVCGDAHIGNFGLYASPQRTMVFDLNDFDEASYGPWEWDVKRYITSVVIAARANGASRDTVRELAEHANAAYRSRLRSLIELSVIDRYYSRLDVERAGLRRRPKEQQIIDNALRAAERRTSQRTVAKFTELGPDGVLVIKEDPPVLTHVEVDLEDGLMSTLREYLATVTPDIAVLLSQYVLSDIVRRVVGVGSVGTRCYIAVLNGPGGEHLVLQIKESAPSVLNQFGHLKESLPQSLLNIESATDHGYRVVANQRILQAVSDPFLGHTAGNDHHYYVRQFRDKNTSFDVSSLKKRAFADYIDACSLALTRGHAQSPNAAFIAGYLGDGNSFDLAIASWSIAYADQSHQDWTTAVEAHSDGAFSVPQADQ